MLYCRRQVMVGGGGENISPTLFNANSIFKLINPIIARMFYGENSKAFAAAIVAVKDSSKCKVEVQSKRQESAGDTLHEIIVAQKFYSCQVRKMQQDCGGWWVLNL